MREKGISFLSVDLACLSGSRAAAISERQAEGREEIGMLAFQWNRLFSGMSLGYQVDGKLLSLYQEWKTEALNDTKR